MRSLQRITRKTRSNEEKVHVFTTQFFSRLEDEGVEGVTSWTSKKGINIFEKKFIFVPVNKDIHWSLFVIVNPGKVYNVTSKNEGSGAKGESTTDEDELEFPFILFMDSLRAHKKSKMKKHIYNWLNSEAKRLGKFQHLNGNDQPFNSVTTPVADPRGAFSSLTCTKNILFENLTIIFFSAMPGQQLGLRCFCVSVCLQYVATIQPNIFINTIPMDKCRHTQETYGKMDFK